MKLKKNIIASICGITLGLAASSSAMAEHELEFELPGGDNPQLDSAQEGGFALAETLLSITAAFVTRGGCAEIGGPFSINVGRDGNGTATYGQVNPIELTVTQDQGPQPDFGTFYNVHQVGLDGQIDP
ncbi:MAG: hypothetical protein KAI17_07545, partial [Thiotrichaceae bacterium]|nr:hypothetical protein [Thiotrichaceae bacterium]